MIRDTGYTSWSLSCLNKHQRKTTCSILLDSMKPQFTDIQWKKSAKYVTAEKLETKNFDPIIKKATDEYDIEIVTEIQPLSEIKDGILYKDSDL